MRIYVRGSALSVTRSHEMRSARPSVHLPHYRGSVRASRAFIVRALRVGARYQMSSKGIPNFAFDLRGFRAYSTIEGWKPRSKLAIASAAYCPAMTCACNVCLRSRHRMEAYGNSRNYVARADGFGEMRRTARYAMGVSRPEPCGAKNSSLCDCSRNAKSSNGSSSHPLRPRDLRRRTSSHGG